MYVLPLLSCHRLTLYHFQLGSKYGTWLLERGLTPKYAYIGTRKEGCGGLQEQVPYQGLDSQCECICRRFRLDSDPRAAIIAKVKQLAQK